MNSGVASYAIVQDMKSAASDIVLCSYSKENIAKVFRAFVKELSAYISNFQVSRPHSHIIEGILEGMEDFSQNMPAEINSSYAETYSQYLREWADEVEFVLDHSTKLV